MSVPSNKSTDRLSALASSSSRTAFYLGNSAVCSQIVGITNPLKSFWLSEMQFIDVNYSVLCCTAGILALLLLPVLAINTHVSENALMPGPFHLSLLFGCPGLVLCFSRVIRVGGVLLFVMCYLGIWLVNHKGYLLVGVTSFLLGGQRSVNLVLQCVLKCSMVVSDFLLLVIGSSMSASQNSWQGVLHPVYWTSHQMNCHDPLGEIHPVEHSISLVSCSNLF